MITFTDKAKTTIAKIVANAGEDCVGLRVSARRVGKHTCQYDMQLVRRADANPQDELQELAGFKAYVDAETTALMAGGTIDYVDDASGSGFHIDNPAAKPTWSDPVAEKVQRLIDEQLGPALAQHGGWLELVEVDGDTAHVQLGGGCRGCAGAQATMKDGIESVIVREVPEIKQVVDDTDHLMEH